MSASITLFDKFKPVLFAMVCRVLVVLKSWALFFMTLCFAWRLLLTLELEDGMGTASVYVYI